MIDPFVPTILYNRDARPFSVDEVELHERAPRVVTLIPAATKGNHAPPSPGPHPAAVYHAVMWALDAREASERSHT